MLVYFPRVYPGEILYSVLARYCRHVGAKGHTWALHTLFGKRLAVASLDLPGHLDALAKRIPFERGLTVDYMIDTLTLFPYYSAFVTPTVRSSARAAMRHGATEDLHVRLGIAAFRVARVTTLRFCPECVPQMLSRYGEIYWHREHQLPSVLMCPEHGCPLRRSAVCLPSRSRHEFVAATLATCPVRAPVVIKTVNSTVHAHLRRLAKLSAALLVDPPTPHTFSGWTAFYREKMQQAGLALSPRKMDQQALEQKFCRHFGECLGQLPGVMVDGRFTGGWLAAMVRKHRKICHPLLHLLLQDFLAGSFRPRVGFGAGPWRCPNPLARHKRDSIQTISQHRNRGRTVGVFECRCGYVYTRNLDTTTGILGPPRFQRFGPLLRPALEVGISDGIGLRAIARRLALDPNTVVALAQGLDIAIPWKVAPSRTRRVADGPPSARRVTNAVKAPRPKEDTRSCARKDWAALDRACMSELMTTANAIRREAPPVRVTRAELERRAGRRGWFAKRRDKLPRTVSCLERVVESVSAFQLRRIYWAIAELERGTNGVVAWRVMRKAGLQGNELARIQKVLDARQQKIWSSAA